MTVELEGKQWAPVPGATATAEDFLAARTLIDEVHKQLTWSPWVLQDRAGQYDAAWKTCAQWACTEPDPPGKTLAEYEAEIEQRLADADARFLADQARAESDRAERARHFDPGRAQARLALLEQQGILADLILQRDEILSGKPFPPATGEDPRRRLLPGLDHDIAATTRQVSELAAATGDPESVADANGWLPAERRELALTLFKARRATEIRDLRARTAAAQATLKSLTGRAERAALREALRQDRARLDYLEQMPPLQAPGMCSECVSPAWHSPATTISLDGAGMTGGPCPAWPRWATGVDAVREVLRRHAQGPPPPQPPPPAPPQPIAVLAPGAPIETVIAQLIALQASHPGAQVRHGRGNRWEIWPAPALPESPGP